MHVSIVYFHLIIHSIYSSTFAALEIKLIAVHTFGIEHEETLSASSIILATLNCSNSLASCLIYILTYMLASTQSGIITYRSAGHFAAQDICRKCHPSFLMFSLLNYSL